MLNVSNVDNDVVENVSIDSVAHVDIALVPDVELVEDVNIVANHLEGVDVVANLDEDVVKNFFGDVMPS